MTTPDPSAATGATPPQTGPAAGSLRGMYQAYKSDPRVA